MRILDFTIVFWEGFTPLKNNSLNSSPRGDGEGGRGETVGGRDGGRDGGREGGDGGWDMGYGGWEGWRDTD